MLKADRAGSAFFMEKCVHLPQICLLRRKKDVHREDKGIAQRDRGIEDVGHRHRETISGAADPIGSMD